MAPPPRVNIGGTAPRVHGGALPRFEASSSKVDSAPDSPGKPGLIPWFGERGQVGDKRAILPPPSAGIAGRNGTPILAPTEFTQVEFATLFMELRGGLKLGRHLVTKAGRGGGKLNALVRRFLSAPTSRPSSPS